MSKYSIAGKELIKGNFGNAVTALTTKSFHTELNVIPSRWRGGNFFFGVNGADKAFIWGNWNSSLIAYQLCPVVSAVINKKAQALVNGKVNIVTGEGSAKKVAIGPIAKAAMQFWKRPNRLQTGRQFRAQRNVYKQIYGWCPMLKMVPVGFENDYTKWQIWNIPPWMLQVLDSTDLFWEQNAKLFQSIKLTYMGHSLDLPPESVSFLRENQISTGTYMFNGNQQNVSLFLPDSKLYALERPIANFIDSLNSRGSLIRNRGPQWLLTNDGNDSEGSGLFPIDPATKDELHKDFLQYGIMSGQRKAIITDAKLKLQEVGFDVAQLKLLEGEVQDAKEICDGLNYPPYLLGLVDAKFDNQQIAERSLYTNSIIPDSDSDDEQDTDMLGLDQFGMRIETDFSHLAALQENITEQGRGRWYMNQALLIEWLQDGITWNQWRSRMGDDTVVGMDVYYSDMVKSGRINPPSPTKNPADPAQPNVEIDTQQQQQDEQGKFLLNIQNYLNGKGN